MILVKKQHINNYQPGKDRLITDDYIPIFLSSTLVTVYILFLFVLNVQY